MIRYGKNERGVTLTEVLLIVTVLAILVALIFPALRTAKSKARRMTCLNNLRQIALFVQTYAEEHDDVLPSAGPEGSPGTKESFDLIRRHAHLPPSSADDKLFACPDDQFYYGMPHGTNELISAPMHKQTNFYSSYSSYGYNSCNRMGYPGIAGRKLSSIREPSTVVLVGDAPAWTGYSWHDPRRIKPPTLWCFDKAQNMIAFVDGHVSYTKFYFDLMNMRVHVSASCNPPSGYEYKWSDD